MKPVVLISYSHKDQEWVKRVRASLRPLERRTEFDLWSDETLQPGDEWKQKIEHAIEIASIAIILVSQNYLASDWAVQVELARLVERARSEKLRIIPVILEPSDWIHTPLAYWQALPRDAQPLSTLSELEQSKVWLELSETLEILLGSLDKSIDNEKKLRDAAAARKEINEPVQQESENTKEWEWHFFISHAQEDGDFADSLKLRMKDERLFAWVDVDVLEEGVDWGHEIDDAILLSDGLILILSKESKSSEYVTYEWAFGLGSGVEIIPILLHETAIHPRLEIYQFLDFTNRRARPWTRLMSLLHEKAGKNRRKSRSPKTQ